MAAVDDVFEAIRAGDADRLRSLVAENAARAAAVGDAGISALMFALYHRREDLVDILLAADPEINVFDAAALGDAAVVTEMLDRCPGFLRARAADGFTLLHLAAFFGRAEVVDLLLARGADVAAVADNPMRVRPLHSAAAAGHRVDEREHQCQRRDAPQPGQEPHPEADPDAQQEGGWTPLHSAALQGSVDLARLLLSFGADPSIRADDGRTPADMAEAKGHHSVATMLRRQGTVSE